MTPILTSLSLSINLFVAMRRHWIFSHRYVFHSANMFLINRMYWAKKILEWTNGPEEALSIAIYLNDKVLVFLTSWNSFHCDIWFLLLDHKSTRISKHQTCIEVGCIYWSSRIPLALNTLLLYALLGTSYIDVFFFFNNQTIALCLLIRINRNETRSSLWEYLTSEHIIFCWMLR